MELEFAIIGKMLKSAKNLKQKLNGFALNQNFVLALLMKLIKLVLFPLKFIYIM